MLVLRSDPCPGESFQGFLLRLSDLNELGGTEGLRRLAIWSIPTTRPELVHSIAAVTGTSYEKLFATGYWSDTGKKRLSFAGFNVHLNSLRRSVAALCPLCIREDGYARQIWDLKGYNACHKHSCALVDCCPTCCRPIRWERPALSNCACGSPFGDIPALPAAGGTLAISRAIMRMIDRSSDALPFDDLEPLLRVLALLAIPPEHSSSIRLGNKFLATGEGASRAAAALADWPCGLTTWIDQRMVERETGVSVVADFGGALEGLRRALRKWPAPQLFDEIRAYLAERWHGSLRPVT